MQNIVEVPTTPFQDQNPGTSGLRKKVSEFSKPHYLENFVQSIFSCFPSEELRGITLLVSGDGRFYSAEAIHKIAEIAAAHGVARLWIGKNGLMSTPAASAVIRGREEGVCFGGILLTASHNPGGIHGDFGIKYNTSNGGPANEVLTNKMYDNSLKIKSYKKVILPEFSLDVVVSQEVVKGFTVEIIDPIEDWMKQMQQIFDFPRIKKLIERKDFNMVYDALHGVAGPYATELLVNVLGAPTSSMHNCIPSVDFNGGHPDPNLIYAKDLVDIMKIFDEPSSSTPDFGAAGDGDADRNMILGKGFFVTPSDSVAIIVAHAEKCIPYFRSGLKGVARSMPTSCALDNVAKSRGLTLYEVPTGWKFFGNLMDAEKLSICGEESFGTGSDHIREKDGLWAVLAWLSILAHYNNNPESEFVGVQKIVEKFWQEFGRNFYMRYDYEEVPAEKAQLVMERLRKLRGQAPQAGLVDDEYTVDEFTYTDPVDHSVSANQGVRIMFKSGSRIIVRLSGTGSIGATIRIYLEKYEKSSVTCTAEAALDDLVKLALELCQVKELCGRDKPTIIT